MAGRHAAPAPGRHRAKGFWASLWESFNTQEPARPKPGRHRAKNPTPSRRPVSPRTSSARQQATSRPQSPMAARSRAYRSAGTYAGSWAAPGARSRRRPQPQTMGPFGWWSR